ncbi:M23 family metallopeptidase [Aestuariivita sp.]|jgi:hypothetical protein|uniref:M23 family metallopeptidase n=1 Tax=Aestuariivita sp. TaxID=1872407 RepID=UPI0021726924|nr:M23 family metallopeptidase [Aestuariivita sp.]MCE8008488.1 M23 family metallopeptidase [Aestuariivita sp.]
MRLLIVAVISAAGPLAADPFLDLPIDCELGKTCFIEDFVDTAPQQGQSADYTCGLNTRDGHRGTDFALLSFETIQQGVAVLAAAGGTVLRVRDSMPDDRLMPDVNDSNACGNAVLIAHENGYETLYCHLRLGSVRVAPGDPVQAGDPLGYVGLSGRTTHPHLHLSVLKDGLTVDPFQPDTVQTCGTGSTSLWNDTPIYHQPILRLAGFSDAVPSYDSLRDGSARLNTIGTDQPLVVYAEAGFTQTGDLITIRASGPGGEVFRDTRKMTNPRLSQLPAFGRRAPPGGWPAGDYQGQITLTRGGIVIANRFAHVRVEN